MTTLLTGGSGFVGAHLARALVERGDRVRCVVRADGVPENLEGCDVELVHGDLRDDSSLREAVRGCSVVYHCAADYRLFARRPSELYATNVEGTRSLLRLAAEESVETVVVTSSVGALATSKDGRPVDEDTPVAIEDMVGHYKRSKFLAERVAIDAARSGQRVLLAHPSTPIGALDVKPTPTGKIVLDFLEGRLPAVVDTALNFVDVRDVAAGHLLVEERGKPGRRYILGGENLSLRSFLARVARVSGRAQVRRRIPHAVPLIVGALDTGLARLLGREPRVPLEGVLMARKKMIFTSARARAELGYRPRSLEGGIEEAVRYFEDRLAPRP